MLYNRGMFARYQLQSPKVRRNIVWGIVIVGIVLLVISFWAWWRYVFTSSRRVFDGMLSNSLRTGSFSKHIEQGDENQKLDQIIYLQSGVQNIAHANTVLSRGGQSAASVTTESVGTMQEDFVRYTAIKTGEKSTNGQPLDFSDILNVWGRAASSPGQLPAGQLYSDTTLGVIPVAGLNPAQREELIDLIHDKQVYKVNYNSASKTWQNGRLVYTYKVEVNTEAYVQLLQKFGKMIGLKQLDDLDSNAYKEAPPIPVEISVDVLSRQLNKIVYTSSDRHEIFSGFGGFKSVEIPSKTISVDELEDRLSKIQ